MRTSLQCYKYRQPSLRAEPADAQRSSILKERRKLKALRLTCSSPESAWSDLRPAVSASHSDSPIEQTALDNTKVLHWSVHTLFPSTRAASDPNPGPTYSHNEQNRLIHSTENINCGGAWL